MRCNLIQVLHLQVVRALPPETNLALLTFGAALSVWQLNPALRGEAAALPAADMFPGHSELSEEALKRLLGSLPRYAAPLSAGRAAAEAAIRSLGWVDAVPNNVSNHKPRQSGSSILQMRCWG